MNDEIEPIYPEDSEKQANESRGPRKKLLRKPATRGGRILFAIVAMAFLVGGVAAVIILTQTLPFVPVNPPSVTAGCANQDIGWGVTPVPTQGKAGFVIFTCYDHGGAVPAFNVGEAAVATPTFNLPAGYVDLWAIPGANIAAGATRCGMAQQTSANLTSGSPVSSLDPGGYSYCADYFSAPSGGFASFTVTWSQ